MTARETLLELVWKFEWLSYHLARLIFLQFHAKFQNVGLVQVSFSVMQGNDDARFGTSSTVNLNEFIHSYSDLDLIVIMVQHMYLL